MGVESVRFGGLPIFSGLTCCRLLHATPCCNSCNTLATPLQHPAPLLQHPAAIVRRAAKPLDLLGFPQGATIGCPRIDRVAHLYNHKGNHAATNPTPFWAANLRGRAVCVRQARPIAPAGCSGPAPGQHRAVTVRRRGGSPGRSRQRRAVREGG